MLMAELGEQQIDLMESLLEHRRLMERLEDGGGLNEEEREALLDQREELDDRIATKPVRTIRDLQAKKEFRRSLDPADHHCVEHVLTMTILAGVELLFPETVWEGSRTYLYRIPGFKAGIVDSQPN